LKQQSNLTLNPFHEPQSGGAYQNYIVWFGIKSLREKLHYQAVGKRIEMK